MTEKTNTDFFVIGISHRNAPVKVREKFYLSAERINEFIIAAKAKNFDSLLVLSTCNRVEIYSKTNNPEGLLKLFCDFTGNETKTFEKHGFILEGAHVVFHLLEVAAGIDSQILGDFQIAGQLKKAYQVSLSHNAIDASLSRLIQQAIITGKKIKTNTNLSLGASSISYAAVQYLKSKTNNLHDKKVLLYGLGKVGKLVCKNLLKTIPKQNITIINRSHQKAITVGNELGINVKKQSSLKGELENADIIIVATGANQPTISKQNISPKNTERIFIDLSLPRNVAEDLTEIEAIKIANLDDLKDIRNHSFEKRKQSLPAANSIISEGIHEFYDWLKQREFVKSLQSELQHSVFYNGNEDEMEEVHSKFITRLTGKYLNRVSA